MTSVAVNAPGNDNLVRALVSRMTSRCRLGLTTNSAPASMVATHSAASVTVPEPNRSLLPYSRLSFFNTSMAPGTVMVTSITEMPPATSASTTPRASLAERARSTGMIPAASSCCSTSFDMILLSFLASDTRRAALHDALYFGTRGSAGVSGSGHGQGAVSDAAFHGPLSRFSHEHAIHQAGGKRISAAYAVEDVDFPLWHV